MINRPELRLYYFPGNGPVQTYSIGVGKDGLNTPVGKTWVVRKQVHPTWHPTEASFREKPWLPKAVPPGPDNPMGDYAMYLGWPAYAIHGTNRVYGVGRRVSHGCIRLYPEGIEKLFREVPVGTKVTVVDQSVKVGWHKGELYMEVLPSLEQIDDLEVNYVITHQLPAPDPRPLIEAKAGREAQRVNWDLVEIERLIRRGIPVKITGTPDEERPEEPQVAEAVRGVEATPVATAEVPRRAGLRLGLPSLRQEVDRAAQGRAQAGHVDAPRVAPALRDRVGARRQVPLARPEGAGLKGAERLAEAGEMVTLGSGLAPQVSARGR